MKQGELNHATVQKLSMTVFNPPPQLSEHTFRWCEPFIALAVVRWPEETRFDPREMTDLKGSRLSPNTFAARMRDAIVSLKRFGWTTTVDTQKLSAMTGSFVISYAPDGAVWWKARGRRGRPSMLTKEGDKGYMIDAGIQRIPWQECSDSEVRALALLLDKERLTGPFILNRLLSNEMVTTIQNEFAVVITLVQEKGQTIIT